jgi:hypothetical protein
MSAEPAKVNMFKIEPKLYLEPTPHIIIDDFITNEYVLDFLANNDDLKNYASKVDMPDYWRFEVYRDSNNPHRSAGDCRIANVSNDIFSDKFRFIVDCVLDNLLNNENFTKMLREAFNPVFTDFYPNFEDTDFTCGSICYGAYNSLKEPKKTIGWHLDQGKTLISGFLYLKEDDDESDDSALHLSKDTIESKRIKYINNRLVIWPNIPTAWHMAETRKPTDHFRRFINFGARAKINRYHDYRTDRKQTPDNDALYPWKDFGYKEVRTAK